jgi:hypothetical protein
MNPLGKSPTPTKEKLEIFLHNMISLHINIFFLQGCWKGGVSLQPSNSVKLSLNS